MQYQSLQEKIQEILSCTVLKKPEQGLLLKTYFNPGIAEKKLSNEETSSIKIDQMVQQGLLIKKGNGTGNRMIYPIPLILLLKHFGHGKDVKNLQGIPALRNIDQWIKYPAFRSPDIGIKTMHGKDEVLRWLFELHSMQWDQVYCFGDYESFIEMIGIEPEQEWIRERVKKGRRASVIATKDGRWAQHIKKVGQKELRNCLITPNQFSDSFVLTFPEIWTTVIGSSDNSLTFIHSDAIAKMYTDLVKRSLIQ